MHDISGSIHNICRDYIFLSATKMSANYNNLILLLLLNTTYIIIIRYTAERLLYKIVNRPFYSCVLGCLAFE